MSRSHKKSPYIGFTTASSEKDDKRLANRKLRRMTNTKLRSGYFEEDDSINPEIRDVSNIWNFAKDGKRYCNDDKELRK